MVIAGENRDRLVALVWLNPDRAKVHAASSTAGASVESLAADSGVADYICHVLNEHNRAAGASEPIAAVAIQTEPPSLAAGEITDKAYINQRAVLENRATVVAAP
ncbi:MAG: hypothetical protein WBX25_04280 [Rhodomicrobium sp.]